MTGKTRRLSRGVSAMLCAWLSVSVWLLAVSLAAAEQVRLDGGQTLEWSLSDSVPEPNLSIAAPATVEWAASGIEGPVTIELRTNYAAFIDRWELGLFRAGDEKRKHPIRIWRGSSATLNAGVEWDGVVESGPALRPGETIVATLRVRDVAGNVDATEPQTILVSRYLMPVERKRMSKLTKTRRSGLRNPPAEQTIPVWGKLLTATIKARDEEAPLRISDLAMRKDRNGDWRLEQIVPPGNHSLKIQTARPILGGVRLISAGRMFLTVKDTDAMMIPVRGTGEFEREPHTQRAEGLKSDGIIAGHDAARLKLWKKESIEGNLALALIDPRLGVPLFKDKRSRNVMRFDPPQRSVLWSATDEPSKTPTIERRARYPAVAHQTITLPHTDIEASPFRLSVRSGETRVTYLIPTRHYILDVLQGRVRLTDAGRTVVLDEAAQYPDSVLESAYHIRQSFAGLSRRSNDKMVSIEGNGEALNIIFESQITEDLRLAAPETETVPTRSAPADSWVSRNFGWLVGG